MDQIIVASIRKDLDSKTTDELREAYEAGERAAWSPEALEAIRQILAERQRQSHRSVVAITTGVVLGVIAAAATWWGGYPGEMVFLAGLACAVMGAASFFLRNLFGQP